MENQSGERANGLGRTCAACDREVTRTDVLNCAAHGESRDLCSACLKRVAEMRTAASAAGFHIGL